MSEVRDLDADAGPFLDGLKTAMSEAAPLPVPWETVQERYQTKSLDLRRFGRACALVGHSLIHGLRVTTITAMTGELQDSLALVQIIEDEARRLGSNKVAWIGRRGWLRHLPQYQQSAIGVKEL